MMIKKSLIILSCVFLFVFAVKADMTPENGTTRVNFDLVLETKEDLSDYKFVLDFHGDKRDVSLNSNARTVIPPSSYGGGARYISAILYAIPKNAEANSTERIKLLEHYFRRDLTILERMTYSPPTYLIEREGTTLKATKFGDNYSYTFLIATIFITLAILVLGILMFRKNAKKV